MCLWDSERHTPIDLWSEYLVDQEIRQKMADPAVVEMCARVSKIQLADLEEFGRIPSGVFSVLSEYAIRHKAEYVVAHNGENYDRPLLLAELGRHGMIDTGHALQELPWIDTRSDIPHDIPPDSLKLKYMAADAGFLNPFAHRAVFDVLTMMRILDQFDLARVLEYRKVPFVTVYASVDYAEREKAKAMRYCWQQVGDRTYPKKWVKRIKADQLEAERKACNFNVIQIMEAKAHD